MARPKSLKLSIKTQAVQTITLPPSFANGSAWQDGAKFTLRNLSTGWTLVPESDNAQAPATPQA